jgi:hypothetical protein
MAEPRATGGLPLLLAALAFLAAGGVWLLSRAVVRDVRHPAYSTLNDTPEGARVLYEALSGLPLDVRRRYGSDPLPAGATLFRIGQPLSRWRLADILRDAGEAAFVAGGGRLVCAFKGWEPDRRDDTPYVSCSETGLCASAAATNRPSATRPGLTKGLGLTALTNLTGNAAADALAARVPWYSAAVFEFDPGTAERWRTLYELEGRPVLIETRFGKGSVVLATDCYFLSNEGLAKDRRPALLSVLVGGSRTVLFDETAHGIRERPNTAWLMRRYRLHGLAAALALPVLLAFWRHACPLLPRAREDPAGTPQQGFRLEDGLVSLLRGHLPAARLPRQLYEAWRQTAAPDDAARREMESLLETAEALRAPPAETCRALHRLARLNAQRSHHRQGKHP